MEQEHEVMQCAAEQTQATVEALQAELAEARGQTLDLLRQTGELAALRRQVAGLPR